MLHYNARHRSALQFIPTERKEADLMAFFIPNKTNIIWYIPIRPLIDLRQALWDRDGKLQHNRYVGRVAVKIMHGQAREQAREQGRGWGC